jgi:hypothetical protein
MVCFITWDSCLCAEEAIVARERVTLQDLEEEFGLLNFGWSRLTGRLGVRRYLLYRKGMVKVGWSRPTDWVLWSELSSTRRIRPPVFGLFSLIYIFSRIDLRRTDGSVFRIIVMGFMQGLPRALDTTMMNATVKQQAGDRGAEPAGPGPALGEPQAAAAADQAPGGGEQR